MVSRMHACLVKPSKPVSSPLKLFTTSATPARWYVLISGLCLPDDDYVISELDTAWQGRIRR